MRITIVVAGVLSIGALACGGSSGPQSVVFGAELPTAERVAQIANSTPPADLLSDVDPLDGPLHLRTLKGTSGTSQRTE